jgi:hypothetical protein
MSKEPLSITPEIERRVEDRRKADYDAHLKARQQPLPMNMQEVFNDLDGLRQELLEMYDATECDPGSHIENCLLYVKLARFRAEKACEAAVREISKVLMAGRS